MTKRLSALLIPIFGMSLLVLAAPAGAVVTGAETRQAEDPVADEVVADPQAAAEATDIAEQWGIEITSLRLSANGHMLDYRYRVLDAEKANDLFKRQIKPYLLHQPSGKVLAVPETAKLGPLRNSNIPQEGKIYWMFFGNAGKIVQAGDKVTVVIGDFRVEDIVVE